VGAGVVGLAVAARLAERRSVLLVDRHRKFGQETSSRNSEVVHSGIYYPKESLKTALCIEGRKRLYAYCDARDVPYRKCGKFVVACSTDDEAYLGALKAHASALDVPVVDVSGERLRQEEPHVRALAALEFLETGIVDSHGLMASLEQEALSRGTTVLYRNRVESSENGERIVVSSAEGRFSVSAECVVNAAGNGSADLARACGLKEWSQRFCRGRYAFLSSRWRDAFRHLIYPTPEKDGLGVHVTMDLDGRMRLGPDVDWMAETASYDDIEGALEPEWETLLERFLQAARRYCPTLELGDLSPGYVGVRPKLFRAGQPYRDFALERRGRWVHCLGIESPGLTSALAIAERVAAEVGV
jgi:L-2-hydroxyglutarate oxidase LhgO